MSNSFVLLCEGFEEVLSNVVSAVGQKLTYDKYKDISLNELFLSEEAFDNFIGGVVLGGGSSGINAARTNETYGDQTALNTNDPKAEKREGYNNYIDPDRFVEGLWDDGKSRIKNDTAENVENRQLENIEKVDESGIIGETKKITIPKKVNSKVGLKTRPYAHLEDGPTVGLGKDFTELQKRRMLEENRKRNEVFWKWTWLHRKPKGTRKT